MSTAARPSHRPDPIISGLRIVDIAFGGKGVGRREGEVVFVPFTIPGELVTVRVTRRKKRFAEAELISVEEASPDRVVAPCPYVQTCGGCSYQHIRYERQLEIKAGQVEQALRRIGKFETVPLQPIGPSPKQDGYRNRIRVHIAGNVVGFYRHDRHEILDIERCTIASEEVNAGLARLRARPVHDGDYTIAEEQGNRFFSQVNDGVAAALLALVRKALGGGWETLIDAYCGSGFFARGCLDLAERVSGIEENAFAVEQARRTAGEKETYLAGDVAEHLPALLAEANLARTSLVLDPPAVGLSREATAAIEQAPPAQILYVSCDPATLARDLALLKGQYDLVSVTPLDMFPQTAEIETFVRMERRGI